MAFDKQRALREHHHIRPAKDGTIRLRLAKVNDALRKFGRSIGSIKILAKIKHMASKKASPVVHDEVASGTVNNLGLDIEPIENLTNIHRLPSFDKEAAAREVDLYEDLHTYTTWNKLSSRPDELSPSPIRPEAARGDFHLFPKLPVELRLKIWKFALEPQVIVLKISRGQNSWHVTTTKKPTLLAVNREAREELLSFYDQPFRSKYIGPYPKRKDRVDINHMQVDLKQDLIHVHFTDYPPVNPRGLRIFMRMLFKKRILDERELTRSNFEYWVGQWRFHPRH